MKKIFFALLLIPCFLQGCGKKMYTEEELHDTIAKIIKDSLNKYLRDTMFYSSPIRTGRFAYFESTASDWAEVAYDTPNGVGCYVTFEHYMWNEGFPESILVDVTYKGKHSRYDRAYQAMPEKDSVGNVMPVYKIRGVNGDALVYDLNGNFIRLDADYGHNPNREPPTYEP